MANNNVEERRNRRRAIFDLQNMLYVISRYESNNPDVLPDGILGAKTVQAIAKFQRNAGMSVSGTADFETWDAIAERYNEVLLIQNRPRKVHFFARNATPAVQRGDSSDAVYLIQMLFSKMADEFSDYRKCDITGNFDEFTEMNVKEFQRVNNLEPCGQVNRETWDRIAMYYSLFGV